MRRTLLVVSALVVLIALDYPIFAKERVVATGTTVYLELAPVDPRSLMQGDYMRLDYEVARHARNRAMQEPAGPCSIVVAGEVGTFRRLYRGEALNDGEHLIGCRVARGRLQVLPDSFLFQEGHRARYERARYGVFKVLGDDSVLVGLADADRDLITSD